MLNIRKIGITLSVLALVGMIGALMAGPAFAAPKPKEAHFKVEVCHFQMEDEYGAGLDEILGDCRAAAPSGQGVWRHLAELGHVNVTNLEIVPYGI